MRSNDLNEICGRTRDLHSKVAIERLRNFSHGRMLLGRARRELAMLAKLENLSSGVPLANEAWSLLLRVLIRSLEGRLTTLSEISQQIGVDSQIALRYVRVLEKERLVVFLASGPTTDIGASKIAIGDEGLLRIARYFLPEPANE